MKTIACFVLLIVCASYTWAQTPDQKAIQQTFTQFQQLSAKGQNEQAMNLTTQATRTYFVDLLTKAKRYKKAQVLAAPMADKISILTLRQQTTDAQLKAMKPADLFKRQSASLSTEGAKEIRNLTNIAVTGNTATATLAGLSNSQQTMNFPFQFARESGVWKLDMVGMIKKINGMMSLMGSSFNTEEQLMKLFQMQGKKMDATIWNTVE